MAAAYTRRAYTQMAEALVDVRRAIITTPTTTKHPIISNKATTPVEAYREGYEDGALAALALVEARIARIFELDNPNFDVDRFCKAAV